MRTSFDFKTPVRKRVYKGLNTYEGYVSILDGGKVVKQVPTKIERTTIDDAIRDAQRLARDFDQRPASNCLSPVERALEAANIYQQ